MQGRLILYYGKRRMRNRYVREFADMRRIINILLPAFINQVLTNLVCLILGRRVGDRASALKCGIMTDQQGQKSVIYVLRLLGVAQNTNVLKKFLFAGNIMQGLA